MEINVAREMKRKGEISRTDDYQDRPKDELQLESALKTICTTKKQGAILLFGEGGVGKTVIASKKVFYNDDLLRDCGIGSAVWLNVYEYSQQDPREMVNELKKLLKEAEFCQNDNATTTQLKTLIVLDDLFSPALLSEAIKLGDNIYILAISRDKNVIGFNTTTEIVQIERLTDEAIGNMFLTMKGRLGFTEDRMTTLVKLCSGLPLIARIILAEFVQCENNAEEANAYYKALIAQMPNSIIDVQWDDEKKQATISNLLLIGYNKADEQFRTRYLAFLFFNEGSTVDLRDLSVFWQCNREDAVKQAAEFRNRSLARVSYSNKEWRLNIHAYLYGAILQKTFPLSSKSSIVKDHLGWRLQLLRQTKNAFHIAITEQRWMLLDAIRAVLLNHFCDAEALFDICSHVANNKTPLHCLLAPNWPVCQQEWQVNNRAPLPILCQLVDKMLNVNWNRAIELMKQTSNMPGHQAVLTALLATVQVGLNWYENALLTAVANANAALREFLLDNGADINVIDNLGCHVLIKAAENANHLTAEKLLTRANIILKVNVPNKQGETALIIACKYGFVETVEVLLKSSTCDAQLPDLNGDTPLHHAARSGSELEIIGLLLPKLNVDSINSTNKNGDTALWLAKLRGDDKMSKMLMDAGAKVLNEEEGEFFEIEGQIRRKETAVQTNCKRNANKALLRFLFSDTINISDDESSQFFNAVINSSCKAVQTLIWSPNFENGFIDKAALIASFMGHTDVLEILFQKIVKTEFRGKNNMTALLWASRYGHREVVALFINNEVDLEARDNNDLTPLMWASANGHREVVALLIEKKADLEARNKDGWSPLMFASRYGHRDVAELLIKNKSDLEARDKIGWTALMWASHFGHCEVVALLIENKADMEARNKDDWSALMLAARYGHHKVVDLLIINKADLKALENGVRSPLMWASRYGHHEVVDLLIKNKADLEARDTNGWSPLIFASAYGHCKVVALLIENNANLKVCDNKRKSPLAHASARSHREVVALLKKKPAALQDREETRLFIPPANGHHQVVALTWRRRVRIIIIIIIIALLFCTPFLTLLSVCSKLIK